MKQAPLSQVLPAQGRFSVHWTGSRSCKHVERVACLFPEVQPKMSFHSSSTYTNLLIGSLHLDPSHSHMEGKGGFINSFTPFHFNVINSKSEIPFLLKASAGPRNRYIFTSKERLSHGSLSRNIPWHISLDDKCLSLLSSFPHNTLKHGYSVVQEVGDSVPFFACIILDLH